MGKPVERIQVRLEAEGVIEMARGQVAELIGAQSREIIFTSCGTESNNTAIHAALQGNPQKRHIITSAVEHSKAMKPESITSRQMIRFSLGKDTTNAKTEGATAAIQRAITTLRI